MLPKNMSILEEREIPIYIGHRLACGNLPELIVEEVKRISSRDDGRHILYVTAERFVDRNFHGEKLTRIMMNFHQCCGWGHFFHIYEISVDGRDYKIRKIR